MKLISPREAAPRLKVHASTVYRVIDRDEVRQETIRVDRHRVQGDEKSEDLLFTSPAFKEKVQAAGGRLVLCEVARSSTSSSRRPNRRASFASGVGSRKLCKP
jgi:hypothetical protein